MGKIYGGGAISSPVLLLGADVSGAVVSSDDATGPSGALLNAFTDSTFDAWTFKTVLREAMNYGQGQLTFSSDQTLNAVAIAGHDCAGGKFQLFLRSVSPGSYTGAATVEPVPAGPFLVLFGADIAAKDVLFRFTFPAARTANVAIIRFGKRVIIPSDIAPSYVPSNYARRVEAMQGVSDAGQFFAPRVRRLGGTMRPKINPVPRAWADAEIETVRAHYDDGKPFFWAGSPAAMPADLAFVRRAEGSGELMPSYRAGGQWVDLSLELDVYGA